MLKKLSTSAIKLANSTLEHVPQNRQQIAPYKNSSVEECQGHILSCHPNFWKFIKVLQKEKSLIRVGIVQNIAGHLP